MYWGVLIPIKSTVCNPCGNKEASTNLNTSNDTILGQPEKRKDLELRELVFRKVEKPDPG